MDSSAQILFKNALHHIQLKEFDSAGVLLHKALASSPDDPDILRILSVNSALQFKFDDALELIDRVISLSPKNALAHSNRGNILKELGRYDEALQALDMAIKLSPTYPEAYSNRGNVLQEMFRYEESLEWYDKAIKLNPQYAEAYSNKGNAFQYMGQFEEALHWFNKSTAINSNYVDGYWLKAMAQLPMGNFEDGFQNYEARWFKSNPVFFKFSNLPRLESLSNVNQKRILIWAEQGLGDTLQFCRYIQPLSQLGAKITFIAPTSLVRVLNSLESFCNLTASISKEEESQFDFQLPLLSLPFLFNTRVDTIPAKIPYLAIDYQKKEIFASQIRSNGRLKVGVIWNGGFRADAPVLWAVNKRRNIDLDQIAILRDIPGIDYYSLQKGDPAESELISRKDEVWPNIVNCAPLINDFSDTAALIENLDLVISVDTSTAHLAGALGKPVWILNRYDSCWRWLRGRSDSPWYPSAKLFQQKKPGDWEEVISRVKSELCNLATQHLSRPKG